MGKACFFLIGLFLLAACGVTADDPQPSPEIATEEIAQISTPTDLPATMTPTPTPIPLATIAPDELANAILAPLGTPFNNQEVALNSDPLTITGGQIRTSVITYTVRRGDTVSAIAERLSLDLCTVVWSNPRHQLNPLRAGNILDILPLDGVFYRVEDNITIADLAAQTGVDPYTIIDAPYNNLIDVTPETVLVQGMKIVVPGGNGGNCNIWASAPPVIISTDAEGVKIGELWGCRYGVVGVDIPSLTPLQSAYTWFRGVSASHTGVDLSAAPGSAVYAAGNGTVAFAGVAEGGYGNAIVIDHGASFTLYAHLSSMNVVCGQVVNRGAIIGGVGSTGISTGPHLHFELRSSGFGVVDPTLAGFFF